MPPLFADGSSRDADGPVDQEQLESMVKMIRSYIVELRGHTVYANLQAAMALATRTARPPPSQHEGADAPSRDSTGAVVTTAGTVIPNNGGGPRSGSDATNANTPDDGRRSEGGGNELVTDPLHSICGGDVTPVVPCAEPPTAGTVCEEEEFPVADRLFDGVQLLVVYGLGSPQESKAARYQLALAVLLRDLLRGLSLPCEAFDPVFTPLDAALLRHWGFTVPPHNDAAARAVTARTLFYMPHCEGWLYDNLLAANWAPAAMRRIIILGNPFSQYAWRWAPQSGSAYMRAENGHASRGENGHAAGRRNGTVRGTKDGTVEGGRNGYARCGSDGFAPVAALQSIAAPKGASCPCRVVAMATAEGGCVEVAVGDGGHHAVSAFNDMALHLFCTDRMPLLPSLPPPQQP